MRPVRPVWVGVWMSGLLDGGNDFIRYAPLAGAWISARPYDEAFEVDLDRVVMRRYEANGQELVEVAGNGLFGTG